MTDKQREVLSFIIEFKKTNGYSPTLNEIMEGVNTHSKSHIVSCLECLVDSGHITMKPKSPRTIVVKKFY